MILHKNGEVNPNKLKNKLSICSSASSMFMEDVNNFITRVKITSCSAPKIEIKNFG